MNENDTERKPLDVLLENKPEGANLKIDCPGCGETLFVWKKIGPFVHVKCPSGHMYIRDTDKPRTMHS